MIALLKSHVARQASPTSVRTFVRALMSAGIVFCLLSSALTQANESECCANANTSKPNIILILADDLGYGDISVNGSRIATPHIDSLAEKGVQFTSAYASANVCTPSRAGLLTGRYPIRTGLAYGVISADDSRGLHEDEVTLAEALRGHGYRTSIIGKWHLGHETAHWPTQHGFDYYFGLPYSNDQEPLALYRGVEVIESVVDQTRLTQRYTEETIKIISEEKKSPFFVFLSHTFPHIPLHVPPEFAGQSEAGLYGDVVEHLDWSTGKIIEALNKTGKLDNTMIIVSSDNGPWFEGSSGSHRGGKGSSWEGAYRVPFIVSWPARIKTFTTGAISMNIDVLPTVLEAVGVDQPVNAELDGKSLMPLLAGETNVSPHESLLFFNNEEVVGVRSQAWKLLTKTYYRKDYAALDKFYGEGYWLLWDMQESDPERYSMASRNPAVLAEMKSTLAQAQKEFDPLRTRAPMKVRY